MTHADTYIFYIINGLARTYKGFDQLMVFLVSNNFLKGGILVMLLWWFWFRDRARELLVRRKILLTLVSCLVSLALIRVLIMVMPFHPRPMHEPGLTFIPPFGINVSALENFSTFPSDHAGLFFALATGIFFIKRNLGYIALLYVFLVICFPRLYLGYHYFTDILAGAAIGIATTWAFMKISLNNVISRIGINWSIREPASFYTTFFLVTYQIAVLFDPLRQMGSYVIHTLTAIL